MGSASPEPLDSNADFPNLIPCISSTIGTVSGA